MKFTFDKACCPECEGQFIRRTRRRGFVDALLAIIRIFPYRCLTCDTRYYSVGRYFGHYSEDDRSN